MPILDIQKRARELGRIRIGQVVPTINGKTRPEKLDRFRLTSQSQPLLTRVAELYGGEVREWTPQGGGASAWEVITTSTRLPIMVPPQPVSQWYEFWTRAGCAHRCDGTTNWQTGEPCDLESEAHLEALKRPTTRLNVVLRDVEGIGVWRLETHGWNAAVELPDAAEFLAQAGGYVNGWVALEERVSVADGQTRRFMVPIIEIDVTPAQLMAGEGRVATPVVEGPVQPKAIEAGPAGVAVEAYADALQQVADATTLPELAGIWDALKDAKLVGSESPASPAREEWVAAWKARAHAIKDAQDADQEPAASPPDGAGEPVEDDPAAADAAWGQLLKAAGELDPPMTTSQVQEWFTETIGVAPSAASVGELQHAVGLIGARSGAGASA